MDEGLEPDVQGAWVKYQDHVRAISDGDAWMKHAAAAEAVALRYYQALDEITDLTDGMADVEDRPDGEGVRPNIFMRIDAIVAEALAKNPAPCGSSESGARTGSQPEPASPAEQRVATEEAGTGSGPQGSGLDTPLTMDIPK